MQIDGGTIVSGVATVIIAAALLGIWRMVRSMHHEVTVESPIWRAHVNSRFDAGDARMGRIEQATEAAAGEAGAARAEAYQCRLDIVAHTGREEDIAGSLESKVTASIDDLAQAIREGDRVGRAAE